MQAALQRGLARGVLAESGLHHIAHDAFVHLCRLDTRAADGFSNNFRTEFRRGKTLQAALEFSDGSAHSAEDHGGTHDCSLATEARRHRERCKAISV